MLSAVGLALDLVGAIALVIGLFGHSQPLAPGWRKTPTEVAHDVAFGIVGGVFLTAGFVLQSLIYYGERLRHTHHEAIAAATAALLLGTFVAYLLYGLLYLAVLGREQRYHRRQEYARTNPSYGYWTRRERIGLRWWRQAPIDPP
jgi:hypothetical protein